MTAHDSVGAPGAAGGGGVNHNFINNNINININHNFTPTSSQEGGRRPSIT